MGSHGQSPEHGIILRCIQTQTMAGLRSPGPPIRLSLSVCCSFHREDRDPLSTECQRGHGLYHRFFTIHMFYFLGFGYFPLVADLANCMELVYM